MPFEPFDEASRFGGGEGGVERGRRMRAQIVLDQRDFCGGGETLLPLSARLALPTTPQAQHQIKSRT